MSADPDSCNSVTALDGIAWRDPRGPAWARYVLDNACQASPPFGRIGAEMKTPNPTQPSSDEAQAHAARKSTSGRGPWRQFATFIGALVAILLVVWAVAIWLR
jgi:hypothetical protein